MALPLLILGGAAYMAWKAGLIGGARKPTMAADEARILLDVAAGASEEEVRAAHRRLILRVHPDAGGSAELARRVNVARDVLIAKAR